MFVNTIELREDKKIHIMIHIYMHVNSFIQSLLHKPTLSNEMNANL